VRKLKLDLETLEVESFEAIPHDAERGTVVGRRLIDGISEITCSCPTGCNANTCAATCVGRQTCPTDRQHCSWDMQICYYEELR
jgi:hypothetical protein